MKKINSIGYADKIIGLATLFLILIPLLLYLAHSFFELSILLLLLKVSLGIGGVIIIFLTILLVIELRQDKKINKYYEDNKNIKIPLEDGLYECQSCGYRQVRHEHKSCSVCGVCFKNHRSGIMDINEIQPSVAETLYIPLAARATETKQDNPVVSDIKAVEIINQLDISNKIIDGGEISTLGILARTKVIDEEVGKKLAFNPNTTVINLGAGLDTRIFRLDNGILKWYDLDLPEVITLRSRFIEKNERIHFISKSILDTSWVYDIDTSGNSNVIIIAEGLLMYFAEEDVYQIFHCLSKHFANADMYFDVVHSYFVGKKISNDFLWGLDRATDIEKIDNHIKLVDSWSTGNLLKERQSLFFRIMNVFMSTKNRSQILHINITGQDRD